MERFGGYPQDQLSHLWDRLKSIYILLPSLSYSTYWFSHEVDAGMKKYFNFYFGQNLHFKIKINTFIFTLKMKS